MEDVAQARRSGTVERLTAIALRTVHLVAVVALGAALLGAPLAPALPGATTLASGALLMALDLRSGRLSLRELAGWVVVAKLAATFAIMLAHELALALFWALVVVSSLSSHAPKWLRHWRPDGRRQGLGPR